MNAKIQHVFGRLVLFGMVFHMVYSVEHFNLKGETYQLIRAEGDEVTESPGSGTTVNNKNGSSYQQCSSNGNCCGMYTWPGQEFMDDPETAPQTCDDLPGIKDDPKNTIACFGPLVYSNGSRRPDPKLVMAKCYDENFPCFCSGKSCMKYTFIMNNADKTIVNETRFCGTLTNVETNSPVTSGCYEENIEGTPYIREVCICGSVVEGYCNSSKATGVVASVQAAVALVMSVLVYNVYFY